MRPPLPYGDRALHGGVPYQNLIAQPVLAYQAGDTCEVADIAGDEHGLVGESGCGDAQIGVGEPRAIALQRRADASALVAEIPVDHFPPT